MTPETHFSILEGMKNPALREDAFRRFDGVYRTTILAWCLAKRLQPADAEDLTQEILNKLWDKLRSFEYDPQKGLFRSWLARLAGNAIKDHFRAKNRHPELKGTGGSTANQMLQQEKDPRAEPLLADLDSLTSSLEAHLNTPEQEAVAYAKARVEPTTWEAFFLATVKKWPAKDIAEKLGMTRAAVFKAKQRLKNMIDEEYQHVLQKRRQSQQETPS